MKKAKKILLLVLCAALLVGATITGTVAYLTSKAQVTNTFTVGNVTITMDEAKVNEYGVAETGAARVTANTYKLVPGHTYTKDPTIHVAADSENCYLFVQITKGTNFTLNGMTGWTLIDATTNVWAYDTIATKGQDVKVFDSITYAADATSANITPAENDLVVVAYAIQADTLSGKNAAEIWGLFTNK